MKGLIRLFSRGNRTPEEKFWNYFERNKDGLEQFIRTGAENYSKYNRLTKELKKYDELLFPEITIDNNDKCVLIITPDGISAGVVPTQNLYRAKPELHGWVVKKFRQAKNDVGLNYEGLEFSSEDIKVQYYVDLEREKVDVMLLIRDYNSNDSRFKTLSFLYLDHILGEYNTITKVGVIDFGSWADGLADAEKISILELRGIIEKELYKVG